MSERGKSPLDIEPTEKGARSIERLMERFAAKDLPAGFRVLAGSEPGIGDLYMNLNRQLAEGKVDERRKMLVAVGVASATGSADAAEFFARAAAEAGVEPQQTLDAVAVATVCGIFNGYYRFRHQLPEEMRGEFESFRAPFNANSFMKSSLDPADVEAICIAVSSVNGCELCVDGHVRKGNSLGLTAEEIDELIKVGAVSAAAANAASALATSKEASAAAG